MRSSGRKVVFWPLIVSTFLMAVETLPSTALANSPTAPNAFDQETSFLNHSVASTKLSSGTRDRVKRQVGNLLGNAPVNRQSAPKRRRHRGKKIEVKNKAHPNQALVRDTLMLVKQVVSNGDSRPQSPPKLAQLEKICQRNGGQLVHVNTPSSNSFKQNGVGIATANAGAPGKRQSNKGYHKVKTVCQVGTKRLLRPQPGHPGQLVKKRPGKKRLRPRPKFTTLEQSRKPVKMAAMFPPIQRVLLSTTTETTNSEPTTETPKAITVSKTTVTTPPTQVEEVEEGEEANEEEGTEYEVEVEEEVNEEAKEVEVEVEQEEEEEDDAENENTETDPTANDSVVTVTSSKEAVTSHGNVQHDDVETETETEDKTHEHPGSKHHTSTDHDDGFEHHSPESSHPTPHPKEEEHHEVEEDAEDHTTEEPHHAQEHEDDDDESHH